MKKGDSLHQDDVFIQKLTQIVLDNLENEQFSVEDLSDQIGMSRSHLYRKIKLLNGQSISQFIRQIRLERAMEMLQEDTATSTEIAYRVGFGSPSYFNKCFQEYYGYPPGEARRKKGASSLLQRSVDHRPAEVVPLSVQNMYRTQRSVRRKWLLVVISLLILMLLDWYLFHYPQKANQSTSIAILPLRYPSGATEQENLAIGLHDALIGAVGKHSNLRVISRTSTLRYGDGEFLLAEIARELGVETILEGSVIGTGDSMQLQLHLIDVFPEERQIWSEEYELDLNRILTTKSPVLRNIARQIQHMLTPKNQDQVDNTSAVGSGWGQPDPKAEDFGNQIALSARSFCGLNNIITQ